jgi:hypothetical protein
MKSTIFFCLLMAAALGQSQTDLNNYKYVVIPNQFSFLKGEDTYQLNSLTEFLFNRKGFIAFLEKDDLPQELFDDRCKALYADVEEAKGGFRKTKLKVILRDCYRNLVYESRVGESAENKYKEAHHEALRDAFVSIDNLDYNYAPSNESDASVSKTDEQYHEEKEAQQVSGNAVGTVTGVSAANSIKNGNEANQSSGLSEVESPLELLEKPYGFDIKDSKGRLVMVLLETSAQKVFLVKGEDALVYREANKWIYSANDGEYVVKKVLNIKNQ